MNRSVQPFNGHVQRTIAAGQRACGAKLNVLSVQFNTKPQVRGHIQSFTPIGGEALLNAASLTRRAEPGKGNRLYRDDLHEPQPQVSSAACLQVVSTASADLPLCGLIRILCPGAGAGRG